MQRGVKKTNSLLKYRILSHFTLKGVKSSLWSMYTGLMYCEKYKIIAGEDMEFCKTCKNAFPIIDIKIDTEYMRIPYTGGEPISLNEDEKTEVEKIKMTLPAIYQNLPYYISHKVYTITGWYPVIVQKHYVKTDKGWMDVQIPELNKMNECYEAEK